MINRKIVFKEPGKVELIQEDFNEQINNPDEIICRNRYSLVSPGTELACLAGIESWFKLPAVPGYIAVGEVLKKGDNINNVNIGDIVYTFGPHAEYYKINIKAFDTGMCIKLPDGLSLNLAPFTRIGTIAMASLRVSDIQLGDYVAVTGLGLVGNLAAQLAQLQGAEVIGIDINSSRIDIAEKCGIKNVVNSSKPGWKEEIKKITNGDGVRTLIDATGISKVIADSLSIISTYGESILLGSPRGAYETDATEIFNHVHYIHRGSITFKGALEWRFPTYQTEYVKHSIERNSKVVINLIKNKSLNIEPLLTHEFNPEDAAKAYEGLKNNQDKFLGVIFNWTN
ncbi:MAG: zinc-binding alcohol dehydrogenase [Ignavibacteriaceae bacterium]